MSGHDSECESLTDAISHEGTSYCTCCGGRLRVWRVPADDGSGEMEIRPAVHFPSSFGVTGEAEK